MNKTKLNWWKKRFFDRDMAKILFNDKKLKIALKEVSWITKVTGLKSSAKVLDVACGIGRHSISFAKLGFDVTGIDISADFLRIASQRAQKEKNSTKFLKVPMHRLSAFAGKFDIVINLFSSFGYYFPRIKNIHVLHQMARALKPGGVIVLDTIYKEAVERFFRHRDWRPIDKEGLLLEERMLLSKNRVLSNHWVFLTKTKRKHYYFKLNLFSINEYKKMFRQNRLKLLGCYGNLIGAPFTRNSFHIVLVAKKY